MKNVKYEKFETQQYLTSQLFTNKETSLLYSLRTKTTKIFKANFTSLYNGNVECPLKCWDINRHEPAPPDTQEHLFVCKKVISNNVAFSKSEYNDLFKDICKQKEVIKYFTSAIEYREKVLKETENPPGDKLDPSKCLNNCCNSTRFTKCTDGTIIGNK